MKVCNPYCDLCAKAHPILEKLYDQEIIDLQIIFTASLSEKDHRSFSVRHLRAIASQKDIERTKKSISDWYDGVDKNHQEFSLYIPLNEELYQQCEELNQMHKWCEMENIAQTPTRFLEGYKLPREYSVNDLLYTLR